MILVRQKLSQRMTVHRLCFDATGLANTLTPFNHGRCTDLKPFCCGTGPSFPLLLPTTRYGEILQEVGRRGGLVMTSFDRKALKVAEDAAGHDGLRVRHADVDQGATTIQGQFVKKTAFS